MTVTPKQCHDAYRNLTVITVKGEIISGVDVHEYRSNSDALDSRLNCAAGLAEFRTSFLPALRKKGKVIPGGYEVAFPIPFGSWTSGFKVWPLLKQFGRVLKDGNPHDTVKETVQTSALEACFCGKGSPEQLRQLLRLAEALGLIGAPLKGNAEVFCMKYLGIDCSGFVSHYLRANGSSIDPMNTPASSYRDQAKLRARGSMTEIQAGDVMAFAETHHVTAINDVRRGAIPMRFDLQSNLNPISRMLVNELSPKTSVPPDLEVVESCAAQLVHGDMDTDGLNCTVYKVKSQNKDGSFQVARQQLDGREFRVWIAPASVWLS